MGKYNGAADLLICMTAVTTCPDVSLDSLVKFCNSQLLYDADCFISIILGLFVVELCSLNIFL